MISSTDPVPQHVKIREASPPTLRAIRRDHARANSIVERPGTNLRQRPIPQRTGRLCSVTAASQAAPGFGATPSPPTRVPGPPPGDLVARSRCDRSEATSGALSQRSPRPTQPRQRVKRTRHQPVGHGARLPGQHSQKAAQVMHGILRKRFEHSLPRHLGIQPRAVRLGV